MNCIRASLVTGNPQYDDIILVSGGSSGNGQRQTQQNGSHWTTVSGSELGFMLVLRVFFTPQTLVLILLNKFQNVFLLRKKLSLTLLQNGLQSHFATISLCINIKSKVQGAILQNGLGLLSTSYQQSSCSPLFAKGTLLWCVSRPTPQCAKGTLFYAMRLSLQKGLFSTIFKRNIALLWNETSSSLQKEHYSL